ncbi:hypothetical protein KJ359_000049 [Pestalotiopsis sp. 9143b]|nr:hypothetical protein KJ359_000049 [Pestalotiopsis sp. 9143b]
MSFTYQGSPPPVDRSENMFPAVQGRHRHGAGKPPARYPERRADPWQGHPDPLRSHPTGRHRSSTRRISASFSTDGPLSSLPTVATSSLTVSTTNGELPVAYDLRPSASSKLNPTSIPVPKPLTATTFETAVGNRLQMNENARPDDSVIGLQHKDSLDLATDKLRAKSKPRALGAIPKSNTLSVITNLTASISRTSFSKFGRSVSISSNAESEADRSFASSNQSARDIEDPQKIHTAQPSEYWSGRFMALQDRFRSEMLRPENMAALISAHAESSQLPEIRPQTAAHMPTSSSNPNLIRYAGRRKLQRKSLLSDRRQQSAEDTVDVARLEDDEYRARRAFLHLESLCTTSEAKKSLRSWQQTYARRVGRAGLLPKGGTMEDSGLMDRLLRRGSFDAGGLARLPERFR